MGLLLKGAAILLIGSGVILAFMQLKENQIECNSPSGSSMPRDYVNSVCINRGLYTTSKNTSGIDIFVSLLSRYSHTNTSEILARLNHSTEWMTPRTPVRTYYPSYRYLWIYLIVGGFFVLLPLKIADTTTLPSLLKTPLNCPDKKKMRRSNVLKFIFQSPKSCSTFFYRHFLAVLSLHLTLTLIILSLNSYLNGEFIFLGFSQYDGFLDEIFPKVASCDVSSPPSTDVEVATCDLLQNDFNRKIFLVLWYFLIPVWTFAFWLSIGGLLRMFISSIWAACIAIDGGIAAEEDLEQDQDKFKEQIKPFKKLRNSQALVVLELKFLMCEVEYREFIQDLEKQLVLPDTDLERGLYIC